MAPQSNDLAGRISAVEGEISALNRSHVKLDEAIEKLTDVSASVKELLAIHDTKLGIHRETDQELHRLIESRHADARREIDNVRDGMKGIVEDFEKLLREKLDEVKKAQDDHNKQESDKRKETEKRIQNLEKWKWIAIGGAVAVGNMLAHIPWGQLLQH